MHLGEAKTYVMSTHLKNLDEAHQHMFLWRKLHISMYVNYVKSDFVVFFRQDKEIIGIH